MADDKILCGDDVITRETPEYRKLVATMQRTVQIGDRLMKEVRPCLLNERYFTTEQVMSYFISAVGLCRTTRTRG